MPFPRVLLVRVDAFSWSMGRVDAFPQSTIGKCGCLFPDLLLCRVDAFSWSIWGGWLPFPRILLHGKGGCHFTEYGESGCLSPDYWGVWMPFPRVLMGTVDSFSQSTIGQGECLFPEYY